MQPGYQTHQEILTQPEAWQQALDILEGNRRDLTSLLLSNYDQVLFTGCGSTYYLSLAAAALYQVCTGQIARAIPAGELLLNKNTILSRSSDKKPTLLIAISRSGSTTETVRAVEQFKAENRGPVIAITNYDHRPLPQMADLSLIIDKGQEASVAQTRSFASMYVTATGLSLLAGNLEKEHQSLRRLPEVGYQIISRYAPLAKEIGENLELDRFYFLGSGIRYGLACEANLKMKEMTLTHSEPFHFLEFRHGPMSMVNPQTVIVGLVSEANAHHESAVLHEMRALGGRTLMLAESHPEAEIQFNSGLSELTYGVLYLPVLQLTAYYRSIAKGLNPDRPNNLSAVVELESL